MKNLNGKRVQMKKSIARWYLDHPEIYQRSTGEMDDSYEVETLIHLMCVFDIPVRGKVVRPGWDSYQVQFRVGKLKSIYFIDRKDFVLI